MLHASASDVPACHSPAAPQLVARVFAGVFARVCVCVCVFCCRAMGDRSGLTELAETASASGKHNVAFLAHFLLGEVGKCVDLLVSVGR